MSTITFVEQLNDALASDKTASVFIETVFGLVTDKRQMFLKHLVMKLQFDDLDLVLQKVNERINEKKCFIPDNRLGKKGNCQQIKTEFIIKENTVNTDNYDAVSVKEEYENSEENLNIEIEDQFVKNEDKISPELIKDLHLELDPKSKAEIEENKSKEMFPCTYCNMTLTRNRDLIKHIKRIHEKQFNSVICEICEKEFFIDDIKAHVKLVHTKETRHKCDLCDFCCFRKQDLKRHMRTAHNTSRYSCNVCDFKSPDKCTIRRHEVRVHSEERNFICNVCGKDFKEKFRLKSHFQISHGNEKFLCESCGKGFPSKEYLKYHEKSHNTDKLLNCTFCERGFVTAQKLKEHMNTHTGEKPFSCPSSTCDKSYTSSSSLAHHKKTCLF